MNDSTPFLEKMRTAGVSEAGIRIFQYNYDDLKRNKSTFIPEESIAPCQSIPSYEELDATPCSAELLDATVVIKLNGGLGTSMGLQCAKSLLPVHGQETFLDLIAQQIIHLRKETHTHLRLLFMNSFNTSEDTLEHMEEYAEDKLSGAQNIELMQSNRFPKISAKDLTPIAWEKNPALEWAPPGHGDLYAALSESGWLDALIAGGIKYAFISNADNLGALLDCKILSHFAKSQSPFLMEVTRRTPADKKGGHLALRLSDNQLLLREVAQCRDEDLEDFQNIDKYQFFNTNNLWIRLDFLADYLQANEGIVRLPMICNTKTVDPRDPQSAEVYQLETAMGSAIAVFNQSSALQVPRTRFTPVKTTSDLFALRSDAYICTKGGQVILDPQRNGQPPIIDLDSNYKIVDSLEGLGIPSLIDAKKLTIRGGIRFTEGVKIVGEVSFINTTEKTQWIAAGTYANEEVTF